jgi:hypothetical protein
MRMLFDRAWWKDREFRFSLVQALIVTVTAIVLRNNRHGYCGVITGIGAGIFWRDAFLRRRG